MYHADWCAMFPVDCTSRFKVLVLFHSFVYIDIIMLFLFVQVLLFVLYGCETWSLILREERRLRMFENRVLRRVFGPKRDEVTEEWRKLHNEELNDLYSLPNIVWVVIKFANSLR